MMLVQNNKNILRMEEKEIRTTKSTKSAIAFTMAAVLAVPGSFSVIISKNVSADDSVEVPEPVAVYDFSDDENVTFSSLAVSNAATVTEDEKYGKIVKLGCFYCSRSN